MTDDRPSSVEMNTFFAFVYNSYTAFKKLILKSLWFTKPIIIIGTWQRTCICMWKIFVKNEYWTHNLRISKMTHYIMIGIYLYKLLSVTR